MSVHEISFSDEGFAERARRLTTSGQKFCVRIGGEDASCLRLYLNGSAIADYTGLLMARRIGIIAGVYTLAVSKNVNVSFHDHGDDILMYVGVGTS